MIRSIFLLFICIPFVASAQRSEFTDHKPAYRKWLDSYIIDKITYTTDRTIIYFRFVADNATSGGAIFYPADGESPWFLKGKTYPENYPLICIQNIRRDGKMMNQKPIKETVWIDPNPSKGKEGYTVFTCEVHFKRLPNTQKVVDLIEGKGMEFNRRHFNCFNVRLKTWDDDLGNVNDSNKEIQQFEEKFNIVEKVTKEEKKKERKKKKVQINTKEINSQQIDSVRTDSSLTVIKVETFTTITETIYPNKTVWDTLTKIVYDTLSIKYLTHSIIKIQKKNLHSYKDLNCTDTLILDRVQFHDNSTNYKGMVEAYKTLNLIFYYMREHPESRLSLMGHADIFGDKERNKELSKHRVEKLQRWLSMYGIHPRRIDLFWYGSERPLIKEGSVKNRRVEIKLICD